MILPRRLIVLSLSQKTITNEVERAKKSYNQRLVECNKNDSLLEYSEVNTSKIKEVSKLKLSS